MQIFYLLVRIAQTVLVIATSSTIKARSISKQSTRKADERACICAARVWVFVTFVFLRAWVLFNRPGVPMYSMSSITDNFDI